MLMIGCSVTSLYERTVLKNVSSAQPSSRPRSKSRSKSRAPRDRPPPAPQAFSFKRSYMEAEDIELGVKTMPISIDVHVEKTVAHDGSVDVADGASDRRPGRAM
jgi:hypothetical protein